MSAMKRSVLAGLLAAVLIAVFVSSAGASDTTVRVTGRLNKRLALSVSPSEVGFGSFDPDVPQAVSPAFTVTVKANSDYLYALECPATFTGPGSPNISHLEWDRLGADPEGYAACEEGTVDGIPFAGRTAGTDYPYALRLSLGYDEEPGADYAANLKITCLLW